VEGFLYEARDIRWESQRLRFKVSSSDAFAAWCGLQKSTRVGDTVYSCAPPGPTSMSIGVDPGHCTAGEPEKAIDCDRLALCQIPEQPCACTATACTSVVRADVSLDIALRDGVGDGSISFQEGPPFNIRVTRNK
jgi:hypothetical protein